MSNSRISVPEAVSIILIVLVAHTLVSLPKNLLNVTGSATLINLLYVGIIMFFLVRLMVKLFKGFAAVSYTHLYYIQLLLMVLFYHIFFLLSSFLIKLVILRKNAQYILTKVICTNIFTVQNTVIKLHEF